jgi:hypothetical protein
MNNGKTVSMNNQEPMPTKSTSSNSGLPEGAIKTVGQQSASAFVTDVFNRTRSMMNNPKFSFLVLGSARKCSEVLSGVRLSPILAWCSFPRSDMPDR